MSRSSMLARLALETTRTYASIEEALIGSLDFATTAGYRRFLCMFYGFQAPLEAALVMTPGMDFELLESRFKSGLLACDLLSIGLTRHEHRMLAHRLTIGPFENIAQAYGWMYATERLMLAVEAVRIRLEIEMPVVTTLANQFLYSYANAAEVRWQEFGATLDRLARTSDGDAVVASARIATESLHGWLTQHAPSNRTPSNDEHQSVERASA